MDIDDIFSKEFNDEINNIVGKILDDHEKSLNSENKEEQIYYTNLLVDYLRRIGRSPEEDVSDVIPVDFEYLNSQTKINILNDCMDKNITIFQSELFINSLEGSFEDTNKEYLK